MFCKIVSLFYGFYVLVFVDNEDKNIIYVVKNKSLFFVGVGEGFNVVVSDVMVMF